jgi:hypothetical protein
MGVCMCVTAHQDVCVCACNSVCMNMCDVGRVPVAAIVSMGSTQPISTPNMHIQVILMVT